MKTKIFIMMASLWPRPLTQVFKMAKRSGFDGVEIMLTNQVIRNLSEYLEKAKELGLAVNWHCWWETGYNVWPEILANFGLIPDWRQRKTFKEIVGRLTEPVVLYSWRVAEWSQGENYRFQAAYCPVANLGNPLFSPLNYDEFILKVRHYKLQLVFDTRHLLEYLCFSTTIDYRLKDKNFLLGTLLAEFQELKNYITEIHLSDLNSQRFLVGSSSNPLLPGMGDIDLGIFLKSVKRSNWQGDIVIECHPSQLFFFPINKLRRVINRIKKALF